VTGIRALVPVDVATVVVPGVRRPVVVAQVVPSVAGV
jgi:hypothetical protein